MILELRLLVAVFLGGCAGALARAGLIELLPHDPGHWPWATFAVNVAGATVLGWVATHRPPSSRGRAFLGTGFCGALTTFSTLQLEVLGMLDAGRGGLAVAYVAASVAAGLAGCALASAHAGRVVAAT